MNRSTSQPYRHALNEEILQGDWYQCKKHDTLYIAPRSGQEVIGPDDDVRALLNEAYKSKGFGRVSPLELKSRLNLLLVAESARRFDADVGYYSATASLV